MNERHPSPSASIPAPDRSLEKSGAILEAPRKPSIGAPQLVKTVKMHRARIEQAMQFRGPKRRF